MKISEFDYHLPDELIAQEPAEKRDGSRMLEVDCRAGSFTDKKFTAFPEMIRSDDILVVNNTKVFPARLQGTSDTGAKIELFLVEQKSESRWSALARPARRLKPGKRISFSNQLAAEVIAGPEAGSVEIEFSFEGDFFGILDQVGQTPLPPYIKRTGESAEEDRERYQTVYASQRGAIAAPTAGFHFTPKVLEQLKAKGTEIVEITLHVGYGTFEPVRVDDLKEHSVAAERYEISDTAANRLRAGKEAGRRIVAIGTTTTRALESCYEQYGDFVPGRQIADLTITPGYEFKAIDALLTNFHLPCSSLLVLVSTFAGHELIMDAYRHAVSERYRFYSYGDCMFIS